MRLLLLVMFVLPALAATPSLPLDVQISKKTTKTTDETFGTVTYSHYVETATLKVTIGLIAENSEISCFFIGRDVQDHRLKYFGFENRPLPKSTGSQTLALTSEPIPYRQRKTAGSTAEGKSGYLYFGWVIVVKTGSEEVVVKSSSAEALNWVKKNPARRQSQLSP